MTSLRAAAPRRALAAAAVVLAAATTAAAMTADADARRLPGGEVSRKLVDGTTVKARLYDEGVRYHPGNVANIGTSREVWVSGKIVANVGGKSNAKGGNIYGGYVVGCQVNLIGVDSGNNSGNNYGYPTATAGGTLHIGPGQAGWVPIIQTTSGSNASYTGYNVNTFTFRGHRGGIAFSQEGFRVNGCAGHASARARFTIEVETETTRAQIVLWGKPFTLGG
ncbi:MspA family porin [Gordonia sp. (in: high G+C Gram-positive bacteria)]|uniref:MspA family porin n=1 Tax=Gordonia sp. (in: high G+C Gram-positive bacteria) TaxID=84139 RepID=UPI0039E4189B